MADITHMDLERKLNELRRQKLDGSKNKPLSSDQIPSFFSDAFAVTPVHEKDIDSDAIEIFFSNFWKSVCNHPVFVMCSQWARGINYVLQRRNFDLLFKFTGVLAIMHVVFFLFAFLTFYCQAVFTKTIPPYCLYGLY